MPDHCSYCHCIGGCREEPTESEICENEELDAMMGTLSEIVGSNERAGI